jgi:hypothetical protein
MGTPHIQNTKICYPFFRNRFLFSDRREYNVARLGGVGVTQLIFIGGGGLSSRGAGRPERLSTPLEKTDAAKGTFVKFEKIINVETDCCLFWVTFMITCSLVSDKLLPLSSRYLLKPRW